MVVDYAQQHHFFHFACLLVNDESVNLVNVNVQFELVLDLVVLPAEYFAVYNVIPHLSGHWVNKCKTNQNND